MKKSSLIFILHLSLMAYANEEIQSLQELQEVSSSENEKETPEKEKILLKEVFQDFKHPSLAEFETSLSNEEQKELTSKLEKGQEGITKKNWDLARQYYIQAQFQIFSLKANHGKDEFQEDKLFQKLSEQIKIGLAVIQIADYILLADNIYQSRDSNLTSHSEESKQAVRYLEKLCLI